VVSAIDPRHGDLTAHAGNRVRPGSQRVLVTGRRVPASRAVLEMLLWGNAVATEQTAE